MSMFDLLRLLTEAKVEFVLVGGLAVALRGYSRLTMDVDIVLAMDIENLQHFITYARNANLRPVMPVNLEDLTRPELLNQWHDEKHMQAFSLQSRDAVATVLDILIRPVLDFETLKKAADGIEIGPLTIPVASIDHLIAMKSGTGRNKDLIDIEELQKIRRSSS
ncbi:MAG: nucleotidyl transferase AbiEii/AbiGii toxin family protein [Sterolibacterium sp.]|nr:nucleotidyl transferase AbiEii/AbiGii toxin family protein [Sterolibacterium sp.]MBP9799309.1 nucleotidyl transferase AbiEii/AbiGii toxin family protein [Sterolibacterium sp.]